MKNLIWFEVDLKWIRSGWILWSLCSHWRSNKSSLIGYSFYSQVLLIAGGWMDHFMWFTIQHKSIIDYRLFWPSNNGCKQLNGQQKTMQTNWLVIWFRSHQTFQMYSFWPITLRRTYLLNFGCACRFGDLIFYTLREFFGPIFYTEKERSEMRKSSENKWSPHENPCFIEVY